MATLDTVTLDSVTLDGTQLSETAGGLGPDASITFEGFGFGNIPPIPGDKFVVSSISEDNAPSRDVQSNRNPNQDGESIEKDQFPARTVVVEGFIRGDTAAEVDTLADNFKRALSVREGQLKVTKIGGAVRFYTATMTGFPDMFSRRSPQDITRAPYRLVFSCNDPFGRNETRTSIARFGQTAGTTTVELQNTGTYRTDPIFFLDFAAASSVTQVRLVKVNTSEEISITQGFSTGDFLEVNAEDKVVKVNGSEVDFDGQFFQLEPRANPINIIISSTSHDFSLTAKFFAKFL